MHHIFLFTRRGYKVYPYLLGNSEDRLHLESSENTAPNPASEIDMPSIEWSAEELYP